MKSTRKSLLGIGAVIVVLIGVLWYLSSDSDGNGPEASPTAELAQSSPTAEPLPQETAAPEPTLTIFAPPEIPDCQEPPMAIYALAEDVNIVADAVQISEMATVVEDPIMQILPAGDLLAHWPFEEVDQEKIIDASGNENNALLRHGGMVGIDAGYEGNALAFAEPGDVMLMAESSREGFLQEPFHQRTVAMWVKADTLSKPQILYDEGDNLNGMTIRLSDGRLETMITSTPENETLVGELSTSFPDSGEWQHITAVFNSGVLILYLNGEPAAFQDNVPFTVVGLHEETASVGATSGANAFAAASGDDWFTGFLDEIRIYGKDFVEPLSVDSSISDVALTATPMTSAGSTVTLVPISTITPKPTERATTTDAPATSMPTVPVSAATKAPDESPVPTAAATAPAVAIQGLPLFDLPFPYDGSNETFGGSESQFRQATQGVSNGGRTISHFDHLFPLYPAPQAANVTNGREPLGLPFGGHILPFNGVLRNTVYSGHPGYDFSPFVRGQSTTPLFAAADGVVHRVTIHAASGAYYVEILHRTETHGHFLSRYWHLEPDEFFEAMRDRVGHPIKEGERIGTIGNTGWSTGHHLHFEIRADRNGDGHFALNETVDPFGFVPSAAYPADPWQTPVNFIDAKGQNYSHPGSPSLYLWKYPLGTSAQMPSDGGGQVVESGTRDGEGSAELCVPEGAIPAGSTLNWSWVPDPPPDADTVGTGHGCVLSVFRPDGTAVTQFSKPIRVVLRFEEENVINVENPRETLAVYWLRPGSSEYERLDTVVNLETGTASAVTEFAGACGLLGKPKGDLVPPQTHIRLEGPTNPNGTFSGPVSVYLESTDSDLAVTQYSLDGGNHWQIYTASFPIPGTAKSLASPDSLPDDEGVEGLIRGPGRYLVLTASSDQAGNEEYPPVSKIIYFEPIVPTATPTPVPPEPEAVCEVIAPSALRQGPGTTCDIIRSIPVGERLPIEGRDSSEDWFQARLANGRLGWIGVSQCAPVQVDVPLSTNIPATCALEPTPTEVVTPPKSDGSSEIKDVWHCGYIGNRNFEWFRYEVFYDEAGNPTREELIDGPFSGPWTSGCPIEPRIWLEGCTVHWNVGHTVTEAFFSYEDHDNGVVFKLDDTRVTIPTGSHQYSTDNPSVFSSQFFLRIFLNNGHSETLKTGLEDVGSCQT